MASLERLVRIEMARGGVSSPEGNKAVPDTALDGQPVDQATQRRGGGMPSNEWVPRKQGYAGLETAGLALRVGCENEGTETSAAG